MHTGDFVIGAVVYLKSGSPAMTVRGIGAPPEDMEGEIGLIQCVWITDGRIVSGDFPVACLQTANPGSDGFQSADLRAHHIRG